MANVKSDGGNFQTIKKNKICLLKNELIGVYVQIALTMVLSSQTSAGLGYLLSVVGESIDTGTAVAGLKKKNNFFIIIWFNILLF